MCVTDEATATRLHLCPALLCPTPVSYCDEYSTPDGTPCYEGNGFVGTCGSGYCTYGCRDESTNGWPCDLSVCGPGGECGLSSCQSGGNSGHACSPDLAPNADGTNVGTCRRPESGYVNECVVGEWPEGIDHCGCALVPRARSCAPAGRSRDARLAIRPCVELCGLTGRACRRACA